METGFLQGAFIMKRPVWRLALVLTGFFWAGSGQAEPDQQSETVSYACGDVVLIGRVADQTFELLPNDGDILGHGRITFSIKVKQVLKGRSPGPIISASVVAHTFLNDRLDFLFVLPPPEQGRYNAQHAWALPKGEIPPIADHCT